MPLIDPISVDKQEQVRSEVRRYIAMAEGLYGRSFAAVDVCFDLRGRAAGMYKVISRPLLLESSLIKQPQRCIRFNPWLFAKYPEDNWQNTIPHEVAHYISDCRFNLAKIKPHGQEWRQIMRDFGAEPTVRGSYELDGIPVRQTKRFEYRCDCRQVALSSYRHKQIQSGKQQYLCRNCRQVLVLAD